MDEQKECPKSIWEEKPLTFTGWPSYRPVRPAYDQEKMDAWLEKLKEEWEAMENQITLKNITIEGLDKEYLILREEADKLEAVKSWYETRIRKYKEQIDAAENPPIDIVQSIVSGILLKGLEGLGEILEAKGDD